MERAPVVLSRLDQLEIENRALLAEVKRLNAELQGAYNDAFRAASETRQHDRERLRELERDFATLLDWILTAPTST